MALLHVCPFPVGVIEVPMPESTLTEMVNEAAERMNKLKDDIEFKTAGRISVSTEIKCGSLSMHLQDYCNQLKPFLVVMATHGHGAVERFFFGSNTIAALKSLNWPLLIIPAMAKFKNIKKIAMACDFKDVVESMPVNLVRELTKEFNATLDVVHVNTRKATEYNDEFIEESTLLQEILSPLNPSYYFLDKSDVAEGINLFVSSKGADLLIVIPKSYSLGSQIFHKSSSKELLLKADIPMLSIHE